MSRFASWCVWSAIVASAVACGPQQADATAPIAKPASFVDASAVAATIDAGPPKPPPFTDVQATGNRTCATGTDGFAYAWGEGSGDKPTRIPGLRGVKKVACENEQTCALDKYGAITCIGTRRMLSAELEKESEKLTGLPPASDFVLTQEGGCAIASGDLWCWRRSRFTSDDFAVVEPVEGIHDVTLLRTDFDERTCAMRTSGPPVCVSRFPDPRPEYATRKGAAGDAGIPPLARIVAEQPALEGARDILPTSHPRAMCAVTKDGSVTCDNASTQSLIEKRLGGARVEKFFDTLFGRICMRLESGEPRCVQAEYPDAWAPEVGLKRLPSAPSALSIGLTHACALVADRLRCWGHASDGQLGDGTAYEHARAVKVPGITTAAHLSVAKELTCAALANGALSCWGAWDDRHAMRRDRDVLVPQTIEVPARASDVIVGPRLSDMLCIKDEAGGFSCQSGGAWLPLAMQGKTIRVVRNGALVTDDDHARRFGRDLGKLVVEQHDLDKAGVRVTDLALDGYCGITPKGDIACAHCGACDAGEAKNALTRIHGAHKYVQVSSLLWRWDKMRTHVCGLTDAGTVECFRGEEIPWARTDRPSLVKDAPFASLTDVVQIVASGDSGERGLLCALDKRGAVFCAGSNEHGQRGIGTKDDATAIAPVVGLPAAVEIGVGSDHACARTSAGEVWCWGSNAHGGAPDGAPAQRDEPVRVVLPPDPG
jgi:hypothetical protein